MFFIFSCKLHHRRMIIWLFVSDHNRNNLFPIAVQTAANQTRTGKNSYFLIWRRTDDLKAVQVFSAKRLEIIYKYIRLKIHSESSIRFRTLCDVYYYYVITGRVWCLEAVSLPLNTQNANRRAVSEEFLRILQRSIQAKC